MKHYKTYVELAQKYGFIYCAWDDGGDFRIMKRSEKKWDEIKDILLHTAAESPKNPNLRIVHDTTIQLTWTKSCRGGYTVYRTKDDRPRIIKGSPS